MTTGPMPATAAPSGWTWLAEPRGVAALLLGWAAFHVGLRLALSSTLTADDAREAVLAQSLQWGYQARQPPLYNWLAWAAFRLLGPGLFSLTVLKYAVLVAAFWLVYLTARRVLDDARLAALGAFSFLLVAPISWTIHEALTHSVTVLAACAGTVYALIRLDRSAVPRDYALLGLAVGVGLLSKFTYVVFLAAVGLAALSVDRFRARVLRPGIVITGLVAALLVLPYALWFVGHGHDLGGIYAREVRIGGARGWGRQARAGLGYIARFLVSYVAPIALALGVCFPAVYRRLPDESRRAAGGRLIGWLLIWMLVLLTGAALVGGLSFLKARWLIPGFFLVPLYGLWRVDRQGAARPGRARALAAILVLAEVAAAGFLAARVVGAAHFRRAYPMNEPYAAVAAELERRGFTGGTIVAGFGTIAGNLAVQLPHARVLHTEYPGFVPPAGAPGQCLLVWDRHLGRGDGARPDAPPADVLQLAAALDVALTGTEPVGVVEAPYLYDRARIRRVHYILFPDGTGRCR